MYLVGQATESRINTGFSISFPDSTGVSQGCQSTIPIRKKSLQKQKRDLASVTIKSHITRSLFLLLYLFSKIVLVPRKRVRNQAGGHSTFLTLQTHYNMQNDYLQAVLKEDFSLKYLLMPYLILKIYYNQPLTLVIEQCDHLSVDVLNTMP